MYVQYEEQYSIQQNTFNRKNYIIKINIWIITKKNTISNKISHKNMIQN